MFKILLLFILGIVASYFIAKAIIKFVPKKVQPFISLLLAGLTIWLGLLLYQGVMAPIKFKQEKVKRYSKVIKQLKVIKDAQAAHKKVTGSYAANGDDLTKFIDTAKFAVTKAYNKLVTVKHGALTTEEEIRVVDTIGYTDVRAAFAGRKYTDIMKVPGTDAKFEMKLGKIEKLHGYMAPVYLVKVSKDIVLKGMDPNMIRLEKKAIENDQVKGEDIRIGSLGEVTDSGNWPPLYDKEDHINEKK